MSLQLPIHIPTMKAEGITLDHPRAETSPPKEGLHSSAPSPVPLETAPATSTIPSTAGPGPAPARLEASEADAVMLAYMNTMERFLATQGALIDSLLTARDGSDGAVGTERETTATVVDANAIRPTFPLLGTVEELVSGQSLVARRVFDVAEDLYLRDHTLGTPISTTDPTMRALPVMPLLFSLEVAAEAGVALFPDRKAVAIVEIRAHQWIFFDEGKVTLRVVARRVERVEENPSHSKADVHVHVCIQQEATASSGRDANRLPTMVEATVVLAAEHVEPPRSRAPALETSKPCGWSANEIYPRRTFHGPLFQGITSITRLSEQGLDGTLVVSSRSGLVRGLEEAELQTDPLLADSLGQSVWLWGSAEPFLGSAYLPFAGGALRFFGPQLAPGTPLELKLRLRRRDGPTVVTDAEAVDAEGKVRVSMEELFDREFPITPALHRLMLEPLDQSFADVQDIELDPPARGARRGALATISGFPQALLEGSFGVWRKALAFLILSPPEREAWRRLGVPLRREIHWLLGRAAAKDALRHHFMVSEGRKLAPADLVLRADDAGRPMLDSLWRGKLVDRPEISISHTGGLVLAIAASANSGRIGVDTEKIRSPSEDLRDGAFSPDELSLLPQGEGASEDEWFFRFWCAKEAVGKALGSGIPLDPKELAITAVDVETGAVTVRYRQSESSRVKTFQRDGHAVAVAALAVPQR